MNRRAVSDGLLVASGVLFAFVVGVISAGMVWQVPVWLGWAAVGADIGAIALSLASFALHQS